MKIIPTSVYIFGFQLLIGSRHLPYLESESVFTRVDKELESYKTDICKLPNITLCAGFLIE